MLSAARLADLLAQRSRIDDAINVLRPYADTSEIAAIALARLLKDHGHVDKAIEVLGPHADSNTRAADELADLLEEQGRVDKAIDVLRPHVDKSTPSAQRLAKLLARHNRIDELTQCATTNPQAAVVLAGLLEEQGRVDKAIDVLRPHVDTDMSVAAGQLADLLIDHGRIDELVEYATTNPKAAFELAILLEDHGDVDMAIEVLRPYTDFDADTAELLISLLVKYDRIDELNAEVAAGTDWAARALRSVH